jgi:hypothetical protein
MTTTPSWRERQSPLVIESGRATSGIKMAHLRLVLPETGSDVTRTFTVEWDQNRRKFVALNDHRDLLGMFPNQSNAIGSAIRDAKLACREGCRIAVKVLQQNGTFRNEYIAQPPPR